MAMEVKNFNDLESKQNKLDDKLQNLIKEISELSDRYTTNDSIDGDVMVENKENPVKKELNKELKNALLSADASVLQVLIKELSKFRNRGWELWVSINNLIREINGVQSEKLNNQEKEFVKKSFDQFFDKAKLNNLKKLTIKQKDLDNLIKYVSDPSNINDSLNLYKEMHKEGRLMDENVGKLVSAIQNRVGMQVMKSNWMNYQDFLVSLNDLVLWKKTVDDILNPKNGESSEEPLDVNQSYEIINNTIWVIKGVWKFEWWKFVFDDKAEKTENWKTFIEYGWNIYFKYELGMTGKFYKVMNGMFYIWDFNNGSIEWNWTMLTSNWDKFIWEWKWWRLNGVWLYEWSDGSFYDWNRKDGLKDWNSQIMIWWNWAKYFWSWKDWKMNSDNCRYEWTDGSIYEWGMKNWVREWFWVQKWKDWSRFSWQWINWIPWEWTYINTDWKELYWEWVKDGENTVFKEKEQPVSDATGRNLGSFELWSDWVSV